MHSRQSSSPRRSALATAGSLSLNQSLRRGEGTRRKSRSPRPARGQSETGGARSFHEHNQKQVDLLKRQAAALRAELGLPPLLHGDVSASDHLPPSALSAAGEGRGAEAQQKTKSASNVSPLSGLHGEPRQPTGRPTAPRPSAQTISAPAVPRLNALSGLGFRPLPPSVFEHGKSHSARMPWAPHARSTAFTSSFMENGRIVPFTDSSIGSYQRAAEREAKSARSTARKALARQERFRRARERYEQRQEVLREQAAQSRREARRQRRAAVTIQRAVRAWRQRIWALYLNFKRQDTAARLVQGAYRRVRSRRESVRLLARMREVVRHAMAVRRIEKHVRLWLLRRRSMAVVRALRAEAQVRREAVHRELRKLSATRVQALTRRWLARRRAAEIRNARANAVQRSVLQSWFGGAQLLAPGSLEPQGPLAGLPVVTDLPVAGPVTSGLDRDLSFGPKADSSLQGRAHGAAPGIPPTPLGLRASSSEGLPSGAPTTVFFRSQGAGAQAATAVALG